MVAPVPAQIPKLPSRLPAAPPRRRSLPRPTAHYSLPTLFLPPLCFHTLTNCFSRNPFVFTLICVAPGCHPSASLHPHESRVTSHKSRPFILLEPLCRLFGLFSALVSFVFNRLQPFFPKHPGGGYPDISEGHASGNISKDSLVHQGKYLPECSCKPRLLEGPVREGEISP
jgi:hypothetical protein